MFGDWTDPTPKPFTQRKWLIPIPDVLSSMKIAENESPRPQDRVFAAYNYYDNIASEGIVDLHRTFVGFEKTFLSGDASVGLRVPFFHLYDHFQGTKSGIDDLTILLKYAVVNEPDAVFSVGLTVTIPTGPAYAPVVGSPRDIVWFQPYLGWYLARGDWYVHGFSSVLTPTDSIASTYWFNDIGVGYWLYRGASDQCLLTGIIPTMEIHVNTPLSHRAEDDPERHRDAVNLTVGTHFVFGERTSLGVALAAPLSSPRPFDYELLANLNWRF
jgi:hypothetical protein